VGRYRKAANDTRTSGVEPEMQVIGAMIVSWIIQCNEAESGKNKICAGCIGSLVCVSVDSDALRCSIFGAGFEERLEDRLWILEVIVDNVDQA